LASPVPLATPRTFEDLRPFVSRDHPLKLEQQLILGRCRSRRTDKQGFDTCAREFLDQQNLIGISSA
jgi:hypothetical protein